ncbi:cytochrome P450 [Halocatena halophila]|uniref:cytochrome P450 n=1 Tax=Halocatena halophila TaxID=2814576 RepID=UPI002ED1E87F
MKSEGPPARPSALESQERKLAPFDWYRQMRSETPVRYDEERDVWDVFRYDETNQVLEDYETFSSERPVTTETETEYGTFATDLMINTDPPRHDELRDVVDDEFTPGAIKQLGPHVREVTIELLEDATRADNEIDLVSALAAPLPVTVIAELLGIPTEDRATFKRWSDTIIAGTAGGSTVEARQQETQEEMAEYFMALFERRKANPQEDLLSTILDANSEDHQLAPTELLGFVALLLIAGNVTTTNLITNAMVVFSEEPDRMETIRSNGSLDLAIEEVLRTRSPIQAVTRVTTRDVEIGGKSIGAGDRVVAWIGSANRDESTFEDPERFVPDREPNHHLAFGSGIHYCLGAHLARLEARTALSTLFEQYGRIEVPEGKRTPLDSGFVYGIEQLPVRLRE